MIGYTTVDAPRPMRYGRELPLVTPLGVFVAGKYSFEVIVRSMRGPDAAKMAIFAALPLIENGWDMEVAQIALLPTTTYFGWRVWRLSRGQQ